jgi:hypothetical protein
MVDSFPNKTGSVCKGRGTTIFDILSSPYQVILGNLICCVLCISNLFILS